MVAGEHHQDLRIIADDRDAAIDVAWETVEEMRDEDELLVPAGGIDVALSIDYSPKDVWSESESKVINPEEGFSVTWHLDP